MTFTRFCEERSDGAIQNAMRSAGLPRFTRNDEHLRAFASSREPNLLCDSREAAKARRCFGLLLLRHNGPPVEEQVCE